MSHAPQASSYCSVLLFALALIAAIGLAFHLERSNAATNLTEASSDLHIPSISVPLDIDQAALAVAYRPLTAIEQAAASKAWAYFEAQTDPETGLTYSVKDYPATTMWELGGQLMATVSAAKLNLISAFEAEQRLARALNSLVQLPLVQDRLPNQSYNAQTLAMTDYTNRPETSGTGVSVLDVMRAVTGLKAVAKNYEGLAPQVQAILNAWDLEALTENGSLVGLHPGSTGDLVAKQEGRLGYEQYAARAALAAGLDAYTAASVTGKATMATVNGQVLPRDKRSEATHERASVLTSEPFLMEVLEYGWRKDTRAMALAVYAAQKSQFERSGLLTVVSEDHLDVAPYFAYTGVLVDDQAFKSVNGAHTSITQLPRFSTKAAFGWNAIVGDEYGKTLVAEARELHGEQGFFAGLYEAGEVNKSTSLNTNALILEALHFTAYGPMLK